MDTDFWLERWQNNQTGFHQDEINSYLTRYWSGLGLTQGSRVLVPLCGKSLDMLWLAEQGHSVVGIELSRLAIEAFFHEMLRYGKIDVIGRVRQDHGKPHFSEVSEAVAQFNCQSSRRISVAIRAGNRYGAGIVIDEEYLRR